MMICGFSPAKTLKLAKAAYGDEFSDEELLRWITSYCKRYFSQQFKRSCLMDGPAVEAFSVSPAHRLPHPLRRREHHVPQQFGGQIKLINLLSLRS